MDTPLPFAKRLAKHVRARRTQLGLLQEELARAAKLSKNEIGKVENGHVPAPRVRTIKGLEIGLQWTRGSVQKIMDGEDPEIVPPSALEVKLSAAFEQLPLDKQGEVGKLLDGLDQVRLSYGYVAALTAIEHIGEVIRDGFRQLSSAHHG